MCLLQLPRNKDLKSEFNYIHCNLNSTFKCLSQVMVHQVNEFMPEKKDFIEKLEHHFQLYIFKV